MSNFHISIKKHFQLKILIDKILFWYGDFKWFLMAMLKVKLV